MVISGHVQNGVVVLDGGLALPEGAVVVVSYPGPVAANTAGKSERIEVPLVSTGEPGTVSLTGEQIANILDREDVSSRRLRVARADVRFPRPPSCRESVV